MAKRKGDVPRLEDEVTPCGKKLRSAEKPSTRRLRKSDSVIQPPVFVVEEDSSENMASEQSARSPKPPSAEEFKAMLRDGLANVAKKEQLDQMMIQIKGNSNALISLERKFDNTNEANEKRFRRLESRIDGVGTTLSGRPMDIEESKRAAYEKSRRSLRAWPISGDDDDTINAGFRDFAVGALLVEDTVVREAKIVDIVRVRSSPQNVAYDEILVTFEDANERDFYFAKARNLAAYRNEQGAPTAGLRMDIPSTPSTDLPAPE